MAANDGIPNELIVNALSEDEELKQYIQSIGWKVLRKAEYLIENGSPSTQLQVMKNLMPAVVKALTTQQEDEKYVKMRAEFEQLRQALVGDILPTDEPDDDDD